MDEPLDEPVDAPATGHPRTAGEAAEAQAYGLTPDDLRDWASFSPIEIYWARKHDVTAAAVRRWRRAELRELRVCDIVRAIRLAMTPQEVGRWADAGFAPSDAVEAEEMGVPLEDAVAWRAAGFILPDAALLIRDGWTLQEAVNARYADIADEDWRPGLREQFPVQRRDCENLAVHGVVFQTEWLMTGRGEANHAAGLVGLRKRHYRAAGVGAER